MNRETQTRLVLALLVLVGNSACVAPLRERVVFAERGIRVGIQHDPTTDRMTPPALNSNHKSGSASRLIIYTLITSQITTTDATSHAA